VHTVDRALAAGRVWSGSSAHAASACAAARPSPAMNSGRVVRPRRYETGHELIDCRANR
jgi:hypothetical protein